MYLYTAYGIISVLGSLNQLLIQIKQVDHLEVYNIATDLKLLAWLQGMSYCGIPKLMS